MEAQFGLPYDQNIGLIVSMTPVQIARFWSNVSIPKNINGCWNWHGRKMNGYGAFCFYDIGGRAHRLSYEFFFGTFNSKLHVCHHCDNPSCVNPNHLFLGTALDNARDRNKKGRQSHGATHGFATSQKTPRGEHHYAAKLCEKDVIEIRGSYKRGIITLLMLSKQFGVSVPQIADIIKRRKWAHI